MALLPTGGFLPRFNKIPPLPPTMKLPLIPRGKRTIAACMLGFLAIAGASLASESTFQAERAPIAGGESRKSVILHDGTHWTLVPAAAVIHLPGVLKDRVGAKAVGELLSWQDFVAKNPGWISSAELTFEEAAGTHPLTPERLESWTGQDKLVVAVHQGGPISLLPAGAGENPARR